MSELAIRPSASRPNGGYATVAPVAGKYFAGSPVFITIFDGFRERYLTAGGQWHGAADKFGPYTVEGDGTITVGPEIVNHMEEYAPITVSGGGLTGAVSWPDGIFAAPGAPAIGQVYAEDDDVGSAGLTGHVPAVDPTPAEEPELAPVIEETAQDPAPETSGSKLWIWLVMAALIIAAVAAYFLLQPAETEDVPGPDEPIEVPADPTNPCSLASLRSLTGGFVELSEAISSCNGEASQEDSFLAVESLAKRNDPAALLAFGHLYNANHSDPFLENELGISLSANPAVAVDYYKQAAEAGSAEADQFLASLCETMRTSGDALQESAADLHCSAN